MTQRTLSNEGPKDGPKPPAEAPSQPASQPASRLARFTLLVAAVSALVTVGVGAGLRWFLAGVPLLAGDFASLRSAHSHMGYYGLLFPLMWVAWSRMGERHPGPWAMGLYALAVAGSFVGFAGEGYGRLSILTSTMVLATWLYSAWGMRAGRGWLRAVAPAIVLGAICIPPVAVVAGEQPELAQGIVRGFLSILLLGAVLPSALALGGMQRPRPWLWLLGVVLSGAFFGPFPALWSAAGPILLAWLLGESAWRTRLHPAERGAWLLTSASMLALGIGVLPSGHQVMVGGFHFLVLGPVLLSLYRSLSVRPLSRVGEGAYLALAAAMGGSVLIQHWVAGPWMDIAAWLGAATALTVAVLALRLVWQWTRAR